MGKIVVGVDGSASSVAALRWAVHQAKLTGCEIEAITAWRMPATYGLAPVGGEIFDFESGAKELLIKAVAEVSELEPDVTIRPWVAEGAPGYVLSDAAKGADLLVVGSHGHGGGFAGMLLGSVSQHCVRHAPCPVLVMRSLLTGGDGHADVPGRDRRRIRRFRRQRAGTALGDPRGGRPRDHPDRMPCL